MPPLELADIFRRHAEEYIESHEPIPTDQKRVLQFIQICRTAALGGHVTECDACRHQEISYNSCRNGHCPKCQAAARAEWLEAREGELLPVEYFHLVFAIPEEFRLIALQNKEIVYAILFRAAAQTLSQVAKDPKHLGAQIGFFGILHTWGQNLCHHPHIHFVIPGGGLSADKTEWVSTPRGFFLPIPVLKLVFRGKFIDFIKRAYRKGQLVFRGGVAQLADPQAFEALLDKASKHEWYIHAKPPFGGAKQVLKYLSRYTHRVAISNQRLVSLNDGKVTFRWKDYADHSRMKVMTLDVHEFIRRFLLHVVPSGFHRIRYYGFLSPRNRTDALKLCRKLLDVPSAEQLLLLNALNQQDSSQSEPQSKSKPCPACKKGRMVIVRVLQPVPRQIVLAAPKPMDTS